MCPGCLSRIQSRLKIRLRQPEHFQAAGTIAIDSPPLRVHRPAMAKIGERASLQVLREKPHGLFLDGDDLGEILLPHREIPHGTPLGGFLDVFLYNDSEDRPVATLLKPKVMPGQFARLKCVAVTGVGAFLDWGLPKDLLVPFREQKVRMDVGKQYVVHVHVDEQTARIIASTRIARHMDLEPHHFRPEQEVDLIVFGKTDLGYKAIINSTHSGLIFANDVFQPLRPGETLKGYIAAVRPDGKIDLTLHAPGRSKVDGLEAQILAELEARGGFWSLGDHSPADEINSELGVSKRTFKQATGALLKKRRITIEPNGIRLMESP
ncbi:MAG: S1-like domain-containing RNA-binding protein [Luteolibacter sp.]